MTIDEFREKASEDLDRIVTLIKSHPEVRLRSDLTYADWFDTLRSHVEVGTENEVAAHGDPILRKTT